MQKLETQDKIKVGVIKRFFAVILDILLIGLIFILVMLFISNAGGSMWRSVSYIGERENRKSIDNIVDDNLPVRSSKKKEFQQSFNKLLFDENNRLKVPIKNFPTQEREQIIDGIISNIDTHFTIPDLYSDLGGQGEFLSDTNIVGVFREIYNENFGENFKKSYEKLKPHFDVLPANSDELFYQKTRREIVKVLFPDPDDYVFEFNSDGFGERKAQKVSEVINERIAEYFNENSISVNSNKSNEIQQDLSSVYLLANYKDVYIDEFKETLRYSFEKFILERIPASQHRTYKKEQLSQDLDKIINEVLLPEEDFYFTTGKFSSKVSNISEIITESVKDYSLLYYRDKFNHLLKSSHLLEIFGKTFMVEFGNELENEIDSFLRNKISSKNRNSFIDKLSEDFINELFAENDFFIPSDKVKISNQRIKRASDQIIKNIIKYHKIYLSKDILSYALNKTSEETQDYLFTYYLARTASDKPMPSSPLFDTFLKYLEQASRGVEISALVYFKAELYKQEPNKELINALTTYFDQVLEKNRYNLKEYLTENDNESVLDLLKENYEDIYSIDILEEWRHEKEKPFEEQDKKLVEVFENYLNKISKDEPYDTFIKVFEKNFEPMSPDRNKFPVLTNVFKKYISIEKNKSDTDYLSTEKEEKKELDNLVTYYKELLSTKTYKQLETKINAFVNDDSEIIPHLKDLHFYRADKKLHLALFVLAVISCLIFLLEGITRLSFGKLFLKIRIGDNDGSRGNIKIYMLRFVIKNIALFFVIIASLFGLYTLVKAGYFIFAGILVLGSIPILSKSKKAIWDMMSGSAVFSLTDVQLRLAKNSIFKISTIVIASLIIIPLVAILAFITYQGISVIDWEFLTTPKELISEGGGGIAHSLIGTLILIIIAVIASVPIGIASGIYLADNPKGKFSSLVRTTVELFQGVPSIIIGLVGYLWLVITMGKPTALAGGLTLALMMFPLVIRSTEETLKLVPHSLKEASLALGVPYYKTILKVVLPTGLSGIVTGILLGIGRIAGETAPLLFTVFGNQMISFNIKKPIDALPLLIYNYATGPSPELHSIAWGASFVLVVFVLLLNLITRFAISRQDK